MITSYKDNMKAYDEFFAFVNGTMNGKIDKIETLNSYFSNIEEILSEVRSYPRLIRLPLQEHFFEINANTREIKIPSEFQTGAGVAGDTKAETIFFMIDRYFDHMDLANQNIAIEFVRADKKTLGYAPAIFVDEKSVTDKLIFGWCLDENVAETYGKVTFSVRFYTIDTAANKLTYSLSTKPATITINKSIYSDLQSASADVLVDLSLLDSQDLEQELISRLTNSSFIQEGFDVPIPEILYSAGMGERDFDADGKIELTLIASGINVKYVLYKKNASNVPVKLEEDAGTYKLLSELNISAQDQEKLTKYVYDSDKETYLPDMGNKDGSPLYVRVGDFEINRDDPNEGTGSYYVEAINIVQNSEGKKQSEDAIVPGPVEPDVDTEPQEAVISRDTGKVDLKATVKTEPKNNKCVVTWTHNSAEVGTGMTYSATEKGAYEASVVNERNGSTSEPKAVSYTVDYEPILLESDITYSPNHAEDVSYKEGSVLKVTVDFDNVSEGPDKDKSYFDRVSVQFYRKEIGSNSVAPVGTPFLLTKEQPSCEIAANDVDNTTAFFVKMAGLQGSRRTEEIQSSGNWNVYNAI